MFLRLLCETVCPSKQLIGYSATLSQCNRFPGSPGTRPSGPGGSHTNRFLYEPAAPLGPRALVLWTLVPCPLDTCPLSFGHLSLRTLTGSCMNLRRPVTASQGPARNRRGHFGLSPTKHKKRRLKPPLPIVVVLQCVLCKRFCVERPC